MADDTSRDDGSVALAERPSDGVAVLDQQRPKDAKRKKKKKQEMEEPEYELEFETPFGKVEFEFEPASQKKARDEQKRENAIEQAAKAALKAQKKAEKQAAKHPEAVLIATQRGGGKLLPILLIFALIAGSIALAIWLFARPGEDPDQVPAEFRNEEAAAVVAPPRGFAATARQRISDAIRAGRRASRDAQSEQQRKFEDLTRQP